MQVELLTPSMALVNTASKSVMLPGIMGYMEILDDHAPMISELSPGLCTIEIAHKPHHFFISGGYVHVVKNGVKILADVGEPQSEIDRQRAEEALKRATGRLTLTDAKVDMARARYAKMKAAARLEVLSLKSL